MEMSCAAGGFCEVRLVRHRAAYVMKLHSDAQPRRGSDSLNIVGITLFLNDNILSGETTSRFYLSSLEYYL